MTSYYLMGLTDDVDRTEYNRARSREMQKVGNDLLYEFIGKHIGDKVGWSEPEYEVWVESREIYFPYISIKQPGLIAFTKTLDHLMKDRQTMIKLSKYLRFIGILDNEVIKRVQDEYNIMQKITSGYQTATGEEITDIYLECGSNGASSCMTYGAEKFSLYSEKDDKHHHPTEVYDTPDVALAYIKDGSGHITARTLLNVPKKQYSTVYGHNSLALQLESEGYERGDLDGVKLKLISVDNGTVCPYIDDSPYVTVENDHLLVSNDGGEYNTQENNLYDYGYLEYDSNKVSCTDCNDFVDSGDTVYVDGHGEVCESCRDQYVYARSSDWSSMWVDADNAHAFEDEWYTDDGLRNFNIVEDIDGVLRNGSNVYHHGGHYYTLDQLANADLMLDDDGDVVHIDDYEPNEDYGSMQLDDKDDDSDEVEVIIPEEKSGAQIAEEMVAFYHDEMVVHVAENSRLSLERRLQESLRVMREHELSFRQPERPPTRPERHAYNELFLGDWDRAINQRSRRRT